jgi:hypothetical protein
VCVYVTPTPSREQPPRASSERGCRVASTGPCACAADAMESSSPASNVIIMCRRRIREIKPAADPTLASDFRFSRYGGTLARRLENCELAEFRLKRRTVAAAWAQRARTARPVPRGGFPFPMVRSMSPGPSADGARARTRRRRRWIRNQVTRRSRPARRRVLALPRCGVSFTTNRCEGGERDRGMRP